MLFFNLTLFRVSFSLSPGSDKLTYYSRRLSSLQAFSHLGQCLFVTHA
jgi:hypothetical protein